MNFDGKTTMRTQGLLAGVSTNTIGNTFTESITPNGYRFTLFVVNEYHGSSSGFNASVQGSNDNTNWTEYSATITDFTANSTVNSRGILIAHESSPYLYHRVRVALTISQTTLFGVSAIQYGKKNSSDPTTSNSAVVQ